MIKKNGYTFMPRGISPRNTPAVSKSFRHETYRQHQGIYICHSEAARLKNLSTYAGRFFTPLRFVQNDMIKTYYRNIAYCAVFILLFCAACGVKYTTVSSPVYSSDKAYVKLVKQVDDKTGQALNAVYDHPKQIKAEKLRLWLSLIGYEQYNWSSYGFDNKWVKQELFIPAALDEIIPQLALGLSKAASAEALAFSVPGRNSGNTSGKMWIKDGSWFCELTQVDGYNYKGDTPGKMDNHDWRLIATENIKVTENWQAKSYQVSILLDTDISTFKKAASAGENQMPQAAMQPVENMPASNLKLTDQKMRMLKQWLKEGLISESQYSEKVKKLLENF